MPLTLEAFVAGGAAPARDRLCERLLALGLEPEPFDSVAAAVAAVPAARPALVLLEAGGEAGLTGDEACRRIKEGPAGPDTAVVLASPEPSAHALMRTWRAGADDLLALDLSSAAETARALDAPECAAALGAKVAGLRAGLEGGRAPAGAAAPLRVLLVDDSLFFRSLVGGALEQAGLEVAAAATLAEARRLLSTAAQPFDAVLTDWVLPDGTGGQLLEALALRTGAQGAPVPVVVLSGFAAPSPPPPGALFLEKRSLPPDALLDRALLHLAPGRALLPATRRAPFFASVTFGGRPAAGGPELRGTGFSYDAAPGALFVRTLSPAPPGTPLRLEVRLGGLGSAPLGAHAEVAWARLPRRGGARPVPPGMGLRLLQTDPQLERQFPRGVGAP